jgi:hypothetical protein
VLLEPFVQWPLAILLTIGVLYALGLMMSYVVGRRIFAAMERLLGKLPVVARVYHSIKQLVGAMQGPPVDGRQIVLVEFPPAQGDHPDPGSSPDPDTQELLAIVTFQQHPSRSPACSRSFR